MSRPTDAQRGARIAWEIAQEALADLPLFPDLKMTPAARREWQAIAHAVHDELELQAWAAGVCHGD